MRIGVFTSGGDAPGMNACIRAVVRAAFRWVTKSSASGAATRVYSKKISTIRSIETIIKCICEVFRASFIVEARFCTPAGASDSGPKKECGPRPRS